MQIFQTIFDWIFPPSEEAMLVRSLQGVTLNALYSPEKISGIQILSSYKNIHVRALIHEAKFHNNQKAHTLLGMWLEKYLEKHSEQFDIIIPIPLSKKRLRERGHNQIISILKTVLFPENLYLEKTILVRTKHTRPQTELLKEKRIKNVQDAFKVIHPESITRKRILVVDDVMTTGATLTAAKAALLPHKPTSVTCLALTH